MKIPNGEQLLLIRTTEANLLGSLFLEGAAGNREAIKEVSKIVTPEDFFGYAIEKGSRVDNRNRRIYEAMLESSDTDYITVATKMHEKGTLFAVSNKIDHYDDISYMVSLTADVIGLDYEHYAGQVAANAREFMGSGERQRLNFKGGV